VELRHHVDRIERGETVGIERYVVFERIGGTEPHTEGLEQRSRARWVGLIAFAVGGPAEPQHFGHGQTTT
jgi:hypothetical protein